MKYPCHVLYSCKISRPFFYDDHGQKKRMGREYAFNSTVTIEQLSLYEKFNKLNLFSSNRCNVIFCRIKNMKQV